MHVSCKDFVRVPKEKVETWLTKTSGVGLRKCFKVKQWGYAFVTVAEEESQRFREAVDGASFRNSPVVVNDGHARDSNSRRPKTGDDEDTAAKRRKVVKDFPPGYIPTLKDIRDRDKGHKGAGMEKSVMQKTAPLMEWPYATQLLMKETYVKSAVRNFTKQAKARGECEGTLLPWTTPEWCLKCQAPIGCGCPLDPIIGTPEDSIAGYRNKCEFSIGHDAEGAVEVGFVLKIVGDLGQVIGSAQDVPHVPEPMKRLCAVVRDCVKASPFPIFDRRRNEKHGVWRTLMARLSTNGTMLLLLQTASITEEQREQLTKSLVEALTSADLGVASIYLQQNDAMCDAAQSGAPLFHVHGAHRLEMPLMGLRFEIGPLSFFQANSTTCPLLYERALSWLRPEQALLLDICCGVGTIGLCAARRCRKVIGIELVPEAVESARKNAALNDITNADFYAGKAEEVLPAILDAELQAVGKDAQVCAVVDPPRPGLHRDVLSALRDCAQLSRIVYISCNPESLADDVVKLTAVRDGEDAFVPVRAVAVDMFPHTAHCEMILLLERAPQVPTTDASAGAASAA